ncbi:MAG TPA: SCO family protein [Candidatus Saccharimonadales bacterium]|nr:SCO family protein [Candidatus Saccharimonadales bacterium]
MRWSLLIKFLVALLGLPMAACRPGADSSGKSFAGRGLVRELRPDHRSVVLQHEAISNYMEAMTMPFRVRDTNELAGLQPGDQITFRLRVLADESWLENVQRIGRAPVTNTAAATPPAPAATNELAEFRLSRIPDFALTNELGQPVRFKDFQGRALAMTFFFTRCPIPEYCPRLTKNFAGAIDRLKAMPGGPTNFHFLSISFDPLDTPLLLRAYARQYHYDSNHWSFITGKPEDIRELARGFGVSVTPAGAVYNHGFSTLIFDATGRLQLMWPIGGDLTDTIVTELTKAARPQAEPGK